MNKKMLKVLGAGGLALFMGVGTLCGVLLAPMNSAQASVGSEETALTSQEKLLSGQGLGLDPENDPVVGTTDWGLDIKFHLDWGSFGTSSATGVSGYIYFTMGTYNSSAVNWVIIGYNPYIYYDNNSYTSTVKSVAYTITNYVKEITSNALYFINNQDKSTPAGTIISSEINNDLIADYQRMTITNAVSKTEIPEGCVLCLSEKVLFNTKYRNDTSTQHYEGSVLQSVMQGLYTSTTNLGLTQAQKDRIVPQAFDTKGHSGSGASSSTDQYFFPLAAQGEKFNVSTYLSTEDKRASNSDWWSRSGTSANTTGAICVLSYGEIYNNAVYPTKLTTSKGVRPAFVLKI